MEQFGIIPVFVTSQDPLDYKCLHIQLFHSLQFKYGVMAVLKRNRNKIVLVDGNMQLFDLNWTCVLAVTQFHTNESQRTVDTTTTMVWTHLI